MSYELLLESLRFMEEAAKVLRDLEEFIHKKITELEFFSYRTIRKMRMELMSMGVCFECGAKVEVVEKRLDGVDGYYYECEACGRKIWMSKEEGPQKEAEER